MPTPIFLLLFRPHGDSDVERLVDDARVAVLRDTAIYAQMAGFEHVVIGTSAPDRFTDLSGIEIDCDNVDGDPMGFAARFNSMISNFRPSSLCYMGSGMPLINENVLSEIRIRLENSEHPFALTNNLYSSDLLATNALDSLIDLPAHTTDNSLALRLRDQDGLTVDVLSRSAETLLDIDTPTDLQILTLLNRTQRNGTRLGQEFGQWLTDAAIDTTRLEIAIDYFTRRNTEALVTGRISADVWRCLERNTASRVRVISEERGLRSLGRKDPLSILGFYQMATDSSALVEILCRMANVVFMDSRPLFVQLGWDASRSDRFYADLHDWRMVKNPELRSFVKLITSAPIPFVLGGHSLMSGGLLAAIDIAWERMEDI